MYYGAYNKYDFFLSRFSILFSSRLVQFLFINLRFPYFLTRGALNLLKFCNASYILEICVGTPTDAPEGRIAHFGNPWNKV